MNVLSGISQLAALSVALSVPLAYADNPIVKHIYTADPAAAVFDDTVYIYTGHDEASPTDTNYRMNDWHVFSSQDMANWQDHGEVLSLDDFSWASRDAWAGQVIKRDDKYYWYVPVNNDNDGWFGIGVAVGNSPVGPFHDAIGHALITDSMTPNETLDIDPTVFIDHDGQAYLYWGNATSNGIIKAVKLKDNMIETEGDIIDIGTDQVPSFTEAPYLHERNGIYYLSYAADWPERIEYSTADNPLGPFTHQGVILNADDVSSPTSHQSIIQYHDQWYLVYHNADLPGGGEYRRSVAVDKLYYDEQGHIEKVTPTHESVGVPGPAGTYAIANVNSNRCLGTPFENTDEGTYVVQLDCTTAAQRQWTLSHDLDNHYTLTQQASGKVLSVENDQAAPGTRSVIMSPAHTSSAQWQLQSADNGAYQIVHMLDGLALDMSGSSLSAWSNALLWPTTGHTNQQWALVRPQAVTLQPINATDETMAYRADGAHLVSHATPFSSSQFRMVSGLADSDGVSFQSIEYPHYYLRHRGFVLYLDYYDGTDLNNADATFYQRTGLADDTAYSFESYNYPGYFLRHQQDVMRVDPVSSAAEQQDATFLIVDTSVTPTE